MFDATQDNSVIVTLQMKKKFNNDGGYLMVMSIYQSMLVLAITLLSIFSLGINLWHYIEMS